MTNNQTNTPEWSGEGLPPVGLEVEAWYSLDTLPGWKPFKLKYFSKESVVFEGMHETYVSRGTFDRWDLRFRPILPVRTPEQPAPVALTDEQILEAMRSAICAADGGYVFDTAPEHVISAGRALITFSTATVAMVLPEPMKNPGPIAGLTSRYAQGWNACLDELKRLNPSL